MLGTHVCEAYLNEEISFSEAGQVRHTPLIDVVQVLQRRVSGGRRQFHERRGGLGAAQHETETFPRAMENDGAGLGRDAVDFKSLTRDSPVSPQPPSYLRFL